MRTLIMALLTCSLTLISMRAEAITISPSSDGNTLASAIAGAGVTISNITYQGSSTSSGTFSDGLSSGIGIESGLVLTTGSALSAVGPNVDDYTTGYASSSGDPLLDTLISGITTDASVLSFDFTTDTGNLFFSYAFASEEYNEYTNSIYNDVFGFFVDGVNIALLADGITPVSINTVNGGNPLGVGATNPDLYNNNDPSDGAPGFNIGYDGFTDVLIASLTGLTPGTHTMHLAISDVGDAALDSAVFIEAQSFSSEPPVSAPIPEPSSVLLFVLGGAVVVVAGRKSLSING